MDMKNSLPPPGGNVGMFADNSVALHWEEYSWRQRVLCQTMNVSQSFVLSGVSALENAPVFEMSAEINVPLRTGLFQAIRETMSRYWDSFYDFIQQWISGGGS